MNNWSIINPLNIFCLIKNNFFLIKQLTKRQIQSRYKGSYLGLAWTIVNPLLMLIIYTFVFSVIFEARWGIENENQFQFAVILYCGLNTFIILQEALLSSPTLIKANENYVKKVVFPLEILNIVAVLSALFNSLIGYVVILILNLLFTGTIYLTVLLLPVIIIPMLMISLGVTWFLSSLGVYIKDIASGIGIISTVLLFMSPIFYPLKAVPEKLRIFYNINPISHIIEECRKVLIYGELPDGWLVLILYFIGIIIMTLGYTWFVKTKDGFVDVL